MDPAPLRPGAIVGHEAKTPTGTALMVESGDGAGLASITPVRADGAKKGLLAGYGLACPAGAWFAPVIGQPGHGVRTIQDNSGQVVATVRHVSHHERDLEAPAGTVRWEQHVARPQYRVEGLFTASRTAMHAFVTGLSKKPFTGEITDALVARPDGALVLLLAAWCTWSAIEAKAQAQSS